MKVDFSLQDAHVAILGVGLMGGSLALALRGKCAVLLGVDTDQDTVNYIRENKVVDVASTDPQEVLPGVDVIILAAPLDVILNSIPKLPQWHSAEAFVFDLGSTKQAVCEAFSSLPGCFQAVGGHPMCGKALGGVKRAEADLYAGATFALVETSNTTETSRLLAHELVEGIGAHPLWVAAQQHDRWVAASSHLPYLVANALAAVSPEEAAPLVGPGWQSTTRLASTPLNMMLPVIKNNRDEILLAVKSFHHQVQQVEKLLESNEFDLLQDLLQTGSVQHGRVKGAVR